MNEIIFQMLWSVTGAAYTKLIEEYKDMTWKEVDFIFDLKRKEY